MAHEIASTNPAVGFYRGVQANLEALSSYRDGAFYITTDTDRLYYAQSETELVYLNKSIQIVSTENELLALPHPIVGEFYYVSSGNKLAYYAGNSQFIQVNSYIDTNTSIKSVTSQASVVDKALKITTSIQQQNKDGSNAGSALSATATVSTSDIQKLIEDYLPNLGDIQVTLNATIDTNKATVALGGMGANTSDNSFTITGSTGITVGGSADAIQIKGTTYSMGNGYSSSDTDGETSVILKDSSGGVAGKVGFSAGEDIVLTSSATNATTGGIEIKHKSYGSDDYKDATISSGTIANGGTVTVVKGVEVSNGHVTGIRTGTFTLPTIPADKYATAVTANANGDIIITMKDNSQVKVEKALYYKLNNETIYNQGDLTAGVTAIAQDLVQNQLSKLTNAMTFRGGLTGADTNSPAISSLVSNVSLGDTWIVASGKIVVTDAYDNTTVADKGDIIIASGTENSDGIIPTANVKWIVIEGAEKDTTYTLSAANNKIDLKEKVSGASAGSLTLADDDIVTLTSSGNTITAAHKSITVSKPAAKGATPAHGGSFTVVTGVTDDGYGHVSEIETTTVTLPAIADQTNNHLLDADKNAKSVSLKNSSTAERGKIVFNNGTDITSAMTVSDNANGDTATVTFSHNAVTRTDAVDNTGTSTTPASANSTFAVVTGVKTSATGHVEGITTKYFKATDTKFKLSGATVSAANNTATVTDTLKTEGGAAAGTSAFSIGAAATGNLTVTASGTQVNLGLVWGTF